MGQALPRGRRQWLARSLLQTHSLPNQTPAATCTVIETLRRQRHTGKQIATEVGISPATVSRILRRAGIEPVAQPGTGRTGAALRARTSRRADPHRHQKARQVQPCRPSHHW
ncbi:helix-turn-helix domain-containing protein [Bradyrhizobium huanghuaihaiense]|uniref:helix-turn-helix domain-containing protein n=1 Tax=Bradyrhizobium huanghuaihaiense TaxID=990078 RepID=UPI0024BF2561|nr:helix-turn-helix domain-containing protein [Bradyrhizobium huanghuaihaiense]